MADSSKWPIMLSAIWTCFLIFLYLAVRVALVAVVVVAVSCLEKRLLVSFSCVIVVENEEDIGKEGVTNAVVVFCDRIGFANKRGDIGGGGRRNIDRGDGSGVTCIADRLGAEITMLLLEVQDEKETVVSRNGRVTYLLCM